MPRSKRFDELCRPGIHPKSCIDVHLSVDALSGLSVYYQAYARCSRDARRTMQRFEKAFMDEDAETSAGWKNHR